MEINQANTKRVRRFSVRVVAILLIFIFMLLLLAFITKEIVIENESTFDESVFRFLKQYQSAGVTEFFTSITFFGSINFLLPAYLLLGSYYLFFKKNSRQSLNIAAIGLSSSVLLFIMKDLFKRHRPLDPLIDHVTGFSFPSGHSFSSFTLAGLAIYIISKSYISLPLKLFSCLFIFVLAVMIATSRVYLHVHFASDVIAGFCLSVIWLTISIFALTLISKDGQKVNTA